MNSFSAFKIHRLAGSTVEAGAAILADRDEVGASSPDWSEFRFRSPDNFNFDEGSGGGEGEGWPDSCCVSLTFLPISLKIKQILYLKCYAGKCFWFFLPIKMQYLKKPQIQLKKKKDFYFKC
jgi:hypothetical protein